MVEQEGTIEGLKMRQKNKELVDHIESTGEALGLDIGDID